ncbi:MAG: beta-galactosidase, partial [Candidatus Hydrogenedentes bacterium]|nr:beta-galactosidase [Candidatus Hydrogenedentota bacterium]
MAAVWGLVAMALASTGCPAPGSTSELVSFENGSLPENMQQHNAVASIVKRDGRQMMQVDFQVVDWPNVFFTPPTGKVWNWNDFAGIEVEVYNPAPDSIGVSIRVDNDGGNGISNCNTGNANIPAKSYGTVRVRFGTADTGVFWGMRGLPVRGPVGEGAALDLTRIVAYQVFLSRPSEPHTLFISSVRLFGQGASLVNLVKLPFIDRFGQYVHAKWPGKLMEDSGYGKRIGAERKAIAAAPQLPHRDRFGGWADGPQREATGWFRTEKVDGKWWLVTPDGHLFFSNGVDSVGTGEQTFITGRDGWFAELPDANDVQFKDMFGEVHGAHSMADIIGGKGRTFCFYRMNLFRKYGPDWAARWRDSVYQRLQSWGFNTIANWAQTDVLANSPMPFTASIGIWGESRYIEGAKGYWGHMRDVYDPAFEKIAEDCIAATAGHFGTNPLCIGYFVDNEMPWETVREGTLASPEDQPCRQELIRQLQEKYGDLAHLNTAWGADAKDWDGLRAPAKPAAACGDDLEAWVYRFARRYFEVVNTAIKRHAPNQLYLGCRFASAPPAAVKACADVVDVVSYNLYMRTIPCERWSGDKDLGKPMIIGEFHFGALDRGMFHTGLVATDDQKDRAAHYIRYIESVAQCPAFVGCHWFQYIDEPTTGRWFDGENYTIGFLDVTDTPYPE